MSVWPACGCGKTTSLAQFSLKDGRRLRTLARVVMPFGTSLADPHPDGRGKLWLTFAAGPACSSDVAGCGPVEDSCSGDVVRFAPGGASSSTVLSFPSSENVIDAVPSPDGRRVALVTGDCAHSFLNYHLEVGDLRSGREWALGADAAPCHALFSVAWSQNGSKLVFPYGPSALSPHSQFQPEGVCTQPRLSGLVVVSSRHASSSASWRLIRTDRGCSFMSATFDPWGIAAIEGCDQGTPPGQTGSPYLGDAYLVQLNRSRREVLRLKLARGDDGGGIAWDPVDRVVLVSESQGANQGVPVFNWVWAFDGHRLRLVRRYPNEDATTVVAEPW